MDSSVVEFACDENGNHRASMADCISSAKKTFNNEQEKLAFIAECTYVYNLDVALGNPKNVHNPHPVLDDIAERCV